MSDRYQRHGDLSWCELMTSDPASAKVFYSDLFGWETEDMSMEGIDYTVVKAGELAVGGIMKTPPEAEGMPPVWGSYISVDDVDAVAAKAPTIGGDVLMEPRDIPGVGRFCVIQDPQGAVISAITYSMEEC